MQSNRFGFMPAAASCTSALVHKILIYIKDNIYHYVSALHGNDQLQLIKVMRERQFYCKAYIKNSCVKNVSRLH